MRAIATVTVLLVLASVGAAAPGARKNRDPRASAHPARPDADRAAGAADSSDDDAPLDDGSPMQERSPVRGPSRRDPASLRGRPRIRGPALRGPSIDEVLSAAYRAAGLDGEARAGWRWRARLAGLVPWLTVRTARDTSWQDMRSEVGHGASFEVRATWRLDRLVFDGRELQVATIEAARRRERSRLASRVIRLYYLWRRTAGAAADAADADDAGAPHGPPDSEPASELAAEAVAELDAVTDGWFSRALARDASAHELEHPGRSTREPRVREPHPP